MCAANSVSRLMRAPTNRPLRLGIIGCGYAAERIHLPVLGRLREVKVVAVAERDPGQLSRVGHAFGIGGRHRNADDLIADPVVEAVGVLVPPTEHASPVATALDARKPVLVEKPLTVSLDEATGLVDRAARLRGVVEAGCSAKSCLSPTTGVRSGCFRFHGIRNSPPSWPRLPLFVHSRRLSVTHETAPCRASDSTQGASRPAGRNGRASRRVLRRWGNQG
jgi:hypothetical protein